MVKASSEAVERTHYGERLYLARTHANLTQRSLADKVGLSQSNINGLEKTGQGSAKTARIAQVCGVRVEWLADGKGPMLDTDAEVPGAARTVASEKVAHRLVGQPGGTDYRTIALTLAAALEESGTELTVTQFIRLLEATYAKLKL
jgi:transcriptional regulator with XRE-family HTH domain